MAKKVNQITEFFRKLKAQQTKPPKGKSYLRGRLVPARKKK